MTGPRTGASTGPGARLLKICGLTDPAEAVACAHLGADAIGVNLWPGSPRAVELDRAAEIAAAVRATHPRVCLVALFVNPDPLAVRAAVGPGGFDVAQLHGDEPPEFAAALGRLRLWKGLRLSGPADLDRLSRYAAPAWERLIIDAPSAGYGGSGRRVDTALAARAVALCPGRVLLAGGLSPDNVAACAQAVRPAGLDVASGVESAPGKKDLRRVEAFVRLGHAALAEVPHD